MREEGWRQRTDGTEPPHADFGTIFHSCAELFDTLRFQGFELDIAVDLIIAEALYLTWDQHANAPLWGTVVDEWTCIGLTWNANHNRRRYDCDAARDWWIGSPRVCPKCNRPTEKRTTLINNHAAKNRLSLLRAVLAYCDADEGLGVASLDVNIDATGAEIAVRPVPALEVELEFVVGTGPLNRPGGSSTIQVHWDRDSSLGFQRFVHERKTTSRYLGKDYFLGYETNLQVATYDLAAHKLGIRCDGVILEVVQVQTGGVRIGRSAVTKGPEQRAETEREILALIADAHRYHADGVWPRRTAVCGFAAGGKPCEFLSVCAAAPSVRTFALEHGFVKEQKDG